MWLWIRNGKGSLAGAGNHPLIARNAQWRIPLGNEHVGISRALAPQPAKRAIGALRGCGRPDRCRSLMLCLC